MLFRSIWTRLIDGVRIGSYTFSLADVLLAGVVFAVAVSVTRYVQRLFETRIFPRTTLDVGVRNSLRRLGAASAPRDATAHAEQWRPWRSYALHHLWAHLGG